MTRRKTASNADGREPQLSLAEIQRLAGGIDVTAILSYREYLAAIYAACRGSADEYSYNQFALDLGFSWSNVLWLVVDGRRKLTPLTSRRLIETLGLRGRPRRYFDALVAYNNARRPDVRQDAFEELLRHKAAGIAEPSRQLALDYFSEWYNPVLRELTALNDFRSDVDWIAERLAFPLLPNEIKRGLQLLEKLGLVRYEAEAGRHVPAGGDVLPDRDFDTLATIRLHQRMSELARDAIPRTDARRREMNVMTLAVNEETAMRIGQILYRTCEEILAVERACKDKTQVYQVNLQLFPLTNS